jgi:diguanylate cyclase (GGDEF)-like protein
MYGVSPCLGVILTAERHKPALAEERRRVLLETVNRASFVLAGLTLAWSLIDWLLVSGLSFYWLLFCRLVASLAFFRLHRLCAEWVIGGRSAVGALLMIPVLFFIAANLIFVAAGDPSAAAAGSDAYRSAAFVLAAGLSLFPLTVIAVVAVAGQILRLMLVQFACGAGDNGLTRDFSRLWRLSVVIGIAGISSVSQLRILLDLTRHATLDLLTGVLTRRAAEQFLMREFSLAERSNTPLALLFVDLDRFKRVNAEYGHEAGDAVLRNAAHALASTMRKHDIIIRRGGEEFVMVLPNTAAVAVADAVERLSAQGPGLKPDGRAQTASIGVAERIADRESLVEAADARMYAAKRSGRNCWTDCAAPVHPYVVARGDASEESRAAVVAAR